MAKKAQLEFNRHHGLVLAAVVVAVIAIVEFAVYQANPGAGAAYIAGISTAKPTDANWYKQVGSLGFAVGNLPDYKSRTGLRFIAQVGNTRDASKRNEAFERGEMSLFLEPILSHNTAPYASKTNDIQGTFTYVDTAGTSLTVPQMSHEELNSGGPIDTEKGIILHSKRAWLNGQPAEVEVTINHAFDANLTVSKITFWARYNSAKAGQDYVNVSYNANTNMAVDTGSYFMTDSTTLWANIPALPAPTPSPTPKPTATPKPSPTPTPTKKP